MNSNLLRNANRFKQIKLYHLVALICLFVVLTFFLNTKHEDIASREYVVHIQRPELSFLEQDYLEQKDRTPSEDFYRGLNFDYEVYPFYYKSLRTREINNNNNNNNNNNRKQQINNNNNKKNNNNNNNHHNKYSITIVTQSTVDRLYKLGLMARKWRAPISAAIFIKDRSTELPLIEKTLEEFPTLREFADLHLLFADNTRYPVNNLRNLAIKHSPTDLVFLMDADFVPPLGLHDYIASYHNYFKINKSNYQQYKKYISNVQFVNQTTFNSKSHTVDMVPEDKNLKVAFVVPSFSSSYNPDLLPDDKSTLLSMVKEGFIEPSNLKVCRKCHSSSNFELWSKIDKPFEAEYQWIYEPYLIFNRTETEWFDEQLKGYGFDKNSHTFTMAVQGYKFLVLPEAFIIHINHPESSWEGPSLRNQIWDNLRIVCEVIPRMKEKYNFDKTKRIFDEPLEDECFSNNHW